jgi:hypothetical protein
VGYLSNQRRLQQALLKFFEILIRYDGDSESSQNSQRRIQQGQGCPEAVAVDN